MSRHICLLLKVDDHLFRGIVDTGAEQSVMPQKMADQLGLSKVTQKVNGQMKGVGSTAITGVIQDFPIQILDGKNIFNPGVFVPVNFIIGDLETQGGFLLGMDFLENIDGNINIKQRQMTIQGQTFNFVVNNDEFYQMKRYSDYLSINLKMKYQAISSAETTNLICRILVNILLNPGVDKFKSINKQRLSDECVNLLSLLGFIVEDNKMIAKQTNQQLLQAITTVAF